MFDKEFFPTPDNVIAKMIGGLKLESMLILEPSAGKGNILDFIVKIISENHPLWDMCNITQNLFCLEKNPDLQNVLRGKGYNVIDSDFLTHVSERAYDIILMNPPYSNAVKHFLQAFEISNGAEIRCLFNRETIDNPYTKERELLLEIMKQHNVEPEYLAKCFSDSERRTAVEVALVKIPKRERETRFNFTGNSSGEKLHTVGDIQNNQLESIDVFESLVHRYGKVKEIAGQVLTLNREMDFYAKGLIDYTFSPVSTLNSCIEKTGSYDLAYERFIRSLRGSAWSNILSQTKISNFVTSSVRQDLDQARQKQGAMAFTVENIENLLEALLMSLTSIKQNCITDAFDILTKYYKDNRVHTEGWLHNDAFFVTKKVILPYGRSDWSGKPEIGYSCKEKLTDIEKALCFVSGKKFVDIKDNTIEAISRNKTLSWGEWTDSEFFKFKLYKKGTLHMQFKDNFIHKQFNLMACKGKNWLPSDYGRTTVNNKKDIKPEAKENRAPVNQSPVQASVNPVDFQPGTEINIDNLLKTVYEIRNKREIIQLNLPVEKAS